MACARVSPRPGTAVLLAVLGLCACASPKARIDRALNESDQAATTIQAEAAASQGEIGMAQALDLPKAARAPLASAAKRQQHIRELATDVRGAVSAGREALPGVRNVMAWWAKLGLWLGVPALGVWALLRFAPALLLRFVPWAAVLMPSAKRASVALLRKQHDDPDDPTPTRVREAIAAGRAGDRQFDALWRHDG